MASTNDVRPGQALDLEGGIFTILEYQHVKPGKGRAFVRMRLRNLETGQVLDRTLPASVEVEVTYTEPGVRGDRVSAATKPATTQTGLVVQVPLFVNIGDRIRVDTRSGSYITRA
ncbi:MAG: hypothetical protein LC739_00565 [Actinobacteria bacterium]|nr:hypothetical protein [Actinomycetota bacterium]